MKRPFLHQAISDPVLFEKLGGKAKNLNDLLVHGFPVPNGFVLFEPDGDLMGAIGEIGGFPVAVRSSGSLEDLANASFAGVYETFLFVRSESELKDAVQKCFDSRHSDRVKDYLNTKKMVWTPETLTMSVLVQKMVDATTAGVLFTMNPTNGFEEECYVEFCQGVGERLVSGHVTPSRIRYNWFKEEIVTEDINQEETRITPAQLRKLMELSIKIQAHYGKPQDIEWAIDASGKVHILQSRPITSYLPREDRPELTNADFKDGGVSARVCTPCMFSVYRDAMQVSMGDYFKKIKLLSSDEGVTWTHSAYGRVYWNAEAVKTGLKKLPDFKEEDFDRDLGVQKDYGEKGAHRTEMSISTVINAIPVLMSLHREFSDCVVMIENFRERFEAMDLLLKAQITDLAALNKNQFQKWFLDVMLFQQETEKKYFRTIYNSSNYQTEFKGFLKRLPAYEAMDEIYLMGELHGISHLDVQTGLARLQKTSVVYGFGSDQYLAGRERFLETHYHHGPAELDITVARWGENKVWVDELVKSFNGTAPHKSGKFKETCERLTEKLGFLKKRKFARMLNQSRDFLRLREEMRSFSTRAYYLLRLGLLEFARRNQLEDLQVFMLDIVEVRNLLINPGMVFPDISKRELMYKGYRNFTPPNEFGGTIQALKGATSTDGLKGLGCSPGEFTGRARVILDIHQTAGLTKEEILITFFTDPGWTPVLARVGGVVTEVGGLLSHAAVIGREYGIPAILNLIDATKLIGDGDLIKINGKTGTVEIIEKACK
ncbi:MAG TPA: PEP/pyruvate-binding domain-containing protein [Bacteriovoracaceae bacterium]|nr:PEP/pyruvate-binding domain-containing protein [Bacteriovoracaceae bacterium]